MSYSRRAAAERSFTDFITIYFPNASFTTDEIEVITNWNARGTPIGASVSRIPQAVELAAGFLLWKMLRRDTRFALLVGEDALDVANFLPLTRAILLGNRYLSEDLTPGVEMAFCLKGIRDGMKGIRHQCGGIIYRPDLVIVNQVSHLSGVERQIHRLMSVGAIDCPAQFLEITV